MSRLLLISASFLLLSTTACGSSPAPTLPNSSAVRSFNTTPPAAPSLPKIHLRIKQAEIEVPTADLNQQFQSILALSEEKRLRNVVLTTLQGAGIHANGRVKANSWLPEVSFRIEGSLSVRPGNVIRYQADRVIVAGIPITTVLDVFGLELANLAKFKDRFGRIVQNGNATDLIVEKFTTDAIIEGQMQQIRSTPQGITVIF